MKFEEELNELNPRVKQLPDYKAALDAAESADLAASSGLSADMKDMWAMRARGARFDLERQFMESIKLDGFVCVSMSRLVSFATEEADTVEGFGWSPEEALAMCAKRPKLFMWFAVCRASTALVKEFESGASPGFVRDGMGFVLPGEVLKPGKRGV